MLCVQHDRLGRIVLEAGARYDGLLAQGRAATQQHRDGGAAFLAEPTALSTRLSGAVEALAGLQVMPET